LWHAFGYLQTIAGHLLQLHAFAGGGKGRSMMLQSYCAQIPSAMTPMGWTQDYTVAAVAVMAGYARVQQKMMARNIHL